MEFKDIIPMEDQYEVAQARANIAFLGAMIVRTTEMVCDVVLSRFNDIHEEE